MQNLSCAGLGAAAGSKLGPARLEWDKSYNQKYFENLQGQSEGNRVCRAEWITLENLEQGENQMDRETFKCPF